MKFANKAAGIAATIATLAFSTSVKAQSVDVDLELALLLDGSGSIFSSDFGLQIGAYQNIFTDPNFYNDFIGSSITDGGLGQVAVSVFQFSSGVTQEIDWTLIEDQASAETFGNAFAGIVQDGGLTNTGGAINVATASIFSNSFNSSRQIIDISTDGVPTTGPNATTASINSIAAGVDAINAIGVGSVDTIFLENNIVRGDDAFLLTAETFTEFQDALEQKLEIELDGGGGNIPTTTPEPATIFSLLAVGSLGIFSSRKRSKA